MGRQFIKQINNKYQLIEQSSEMGCVSSQNKKVNRHQSRTQQMTEPPIIDDYHFQTVATNGEVSDKACGYNFADNAIINGPVRNGQAPAVSQGISPRDQVVILIEKCNFYYQNHDIDTANDYLNQIQVLREKHSANLKNIQQIQRNLYRYNRLLSQVRQQYNDVITFQNQILKGGWVEKSNRNGVRVSTRREHQTVGVLVQSTVEQYFQVLISFCIEMDLYKQFMPFMSVSRQEKIVARNCRIGYTQSNFPIISVRQAYFQGIGYNRLHKNNTLFLLTRSIHNRPDLQQKLQYKCKVNEDYVQLEYKYFVLWYQPQKRGKGKITLAMNVDTKMNFIPLWIQDKVSQDFGEQFFENILKLSRKFKGSLWERNTDKQPELFLFFKTAVDEYLSSKERNQSSAKNILNNQSMETESRSKFI